MPRAKRPFADVRSWREPPLLPKKRRFASRLAFMTTGEHCLAGFRVLDDAVFSTVVEPRSFVVDGAAKRQTLRQGSLNSLLGALPV